MNILGLSIKRTSSENTNIKTEVIADRVPEVKVQIPQSKKASSVKLVKNPTLQYSTQRGIGRGQFAEAEYDLAASGRVEDTDSYVKQAFDKKVALMFKEGWDIVGKNPRTIKYVRARLAQIARASGQPTAKLFRDLGSSLIRKSNAFIVKVRKAEASGGAIRTLPGSGVKLQPVAAYFTVPAETMEYQSSNHQVTRWRQRMPDGTYKEWNPRDVEHFYFGKKDGFIFGTPPLVPVIDDIRALRKIEENIELLVYQHLFPLFQYKVGTPEQPAGFDEFGNREIDNVRAEIQYMPTEGGIVTPERHEIKAIGAEGRALRAEGYLEHFKKRVFAGLGISAVDMGEGETANRATADNMSRNLVDAVKDLQQVFEIFVNEFIIAELLLESTFGADVLEDENICRLKFKEIDIDAQIKKDNHQADLFNKDVTTWDEARSKIGYDPIIVPTPEEAELGNDNPEEYPEWHKTRWKLFEEPKLLIQSIDEPYSLAAKAAISNNSLGITRPQAEEATKEKQAQEKAAQETKPVKAKDSFLLDTFQAIKEDVAIRAAQPEFDVEWITSQIRTAMAPTIDRLVADQMVAFRSGYAKYGRLDQMDFLDHSKLARGKFRNRAETYINKLTNNIINGIKRQPDLIGSNDLSIRVRSVFDVVEHRVNFIEDVEVKKAYNFGMISAMKTNGGGTIYSKTTSEDACAVCVSENGLASDVENALLEDLVPHHPGCNCTLEVLRMPNEVLTDSYIQDGQSPKDIIPDDEHAECPTCSKTAIRKKDSPNTYVCRACKTFFSVKKTKVSATSEEQDELPEVTSL